MIYKRVLDVAGAMIGLLIFAAPMIVISVLIKLQSAGPVLFCQNRLGHHGKVFKMYKFRSMIVGAETIGTGLNSYADDPRVTKLGWFLRRTSLDELPQLFNVLAGTMSLVGPRPPVDYELGPYENFTSKMRKRFLLKPGITGLSQVLGRNDLSWDEKIKLDNEYVDRFATWGIFLDLNLILKTLWVVIRGKNVFGKKLEIAE